MNELREAAIGYYNNGSTEQQKLASEFFWALDIDRDGRVSLQEYTDFLRRTAGLAWVSPDMFQELDHNKDGELDFWEVLTLYYVARTRTISCRTCLGRLNGLYFTCVTCFESPCEETFDLCVKCHMRRTDGHPHGLFLDSYVLLRSKRSHHPVQPLGDQNPAQQEPLLQPLGDQNLAQQEPLLQPLGDQNPAQQEPLLQPPEDQNLEEEEPPEDQNLEEEEEEEEPPRMELEDAFTALEIAVTVGTLLCTIM